MPLRDEGYYSDFEVVGNNLVITLTDEGQRYLDELKEGGDGKDVLGQEQTERDFLTEDHLENSDWEWVRPEEIGALTSAPILGYAVVRNDDGEIELPDDGVTKFFWFPDYAIRSFLKVLDKTGRVTFTGVD